MFFETKKELATRFPDSFVTGERTDFGDNYRATLDNWRKARSTWSKEETYNEVLEPILKDIYDKTGTVIGNFGSARDEYYTDTDPISMLYNKKVGATPGSNTNYFEEGIAAVNNVYKNNPDIYKDQPFLTKDLIAFRAKKLAHESEHHLADVTSRSDSIFGKAAGAGISEMQDIFQNPILAATMFYGSWNVGLGRFILREAALGGGITAATRPQIAAWRAENELPYSLKEAATEVGTAAVFSGIFGGSLKGVVSGFKYLRGQGVKFSKGEQAEFTKMEMDLEDLNNNPYHTVLTKEQDVNQATDILLSKLSDIKKKDPIEISAAEQLHIKNIDTATNILLGNLKKLEEIDTTSMPVVPPKSVDDIVITTQPEGHQFFKPEELTVDAKQFQFKEGGDKFGVNEGLKGVKVWEQERTGSVIVYERLDGTKVIVDGHQRLGLAKRILAQKDGQNPLLSGYIYREADGFEPEFVMVKAALKNIGEGSGTTLDAAKVLKITPEQAANLPKASSFVRQARELSELTDESFRFVNNGLIKPNHAAIVGRVVSDKSKHTPIIKLLIETEPKNDVEAESIVRQAMNVEFTSKTNLTLFGEENIVESLFKERATILDKSLKILNDDKRTFANLNRNRNEIQKEGNVLQTKLNEQREITSGAAAQIIQNLANRKGAVSDALSEAAKKFKEDGNANKAAKQFAAIVKREIESGNVSGDSFSGTGRNTPTQEEGLEIAASSKQLSDFDDPIKGAGVKNQGDSLQSRFEEEHNLNAKEDVEAAFQEDIELRKDLGKLIDEGADEATIEAHPAIVNAMEEAMSIPVTSGKRGFDTDEWWDNRVFKFGEEEVIGDGEALKRLYDSAKKLAWEDDKLIAPINPVRQNKELTIVLGPPASGKSMIANRIGQKTRSMIIDSDEAKKVLPEFKGGTGSNAVHKESQLLSEKMQDIAMSEGQNIVIPTVGQIDTKIINLMKKYKEAGYKVNLTLMEVTPKNVMSRMLRRFVTTGKLIPLHVVKAVEDKPIKTYNKLKRSADGYAKIDNNQKFGQDPTVKEIKSELLQGDDFRLREGGGRSDSGVPIQPFKEENLSLDEIPVGQRIDENGQIIIDYKSPSEILDDIKQEKAMLDRLRGCV